MKTSEVIFSQHSPVMAVDTELVGKDGASIDTPRGILFKTPGS